MSNLSEFPLSLKLQYLEKLKYHLGIGNKKQNQVPLVFNSQNNSRYDYQQFKKIQYEITTYLEQNNLQQGDHDLSLTPYFSLSPSRQMKLRKINSNLSRNKSLTTGKATRTLDTPSKLTVDKVSPRVGNSGNSQLIRISTKGKRHKKNNDSSTSTTPITSSKKRVKSPNTSSSLYHSPNDTFDVDSSGEQFTTPSSSAGRSFYIEKDGKLTQECKLNDSFTELEKHINTIDDLKKLITEIEEEAFLKLPPSSHSKKRTIDDSLLIDTLSRKREKLEEFEIPSLPISPIFSPPASADKNEIKPKYIDDLEVKKFSEYQSYLKNIDDILNQMHQDKEIFENNLGLYTQLTTTIHNTLIKIVEIRDKTKEKEKNTDLENLIERINFKSDKLFIKYIKFSLNQPISVDDYSVDISEKKPEKKPKGIIYGEEDEVSNHDEMKNLLKKIKNNKQYYLDQLKKINTEKKKKKFKDNLLKLDNLCYDISVYFQDDDTSYSQFLLPNPRRYFNSDLQDGFCFTKYYPGSTLDSTKSPVSSIREDSKNSLEEQFSKMVKEEIENSLKKSLSEIEAYISYQTPWEKAYDFIENAPIISIFANIFTRSQIAPESISTRLGVAKLLRDSFAASLTALPSIKNFNDYIEFHKNITIGLQQNLMRITSINNDYPSSINKDKSSRLRKIFISSLTRHKTSKMHAGFIQAQLQMNKWNADSKKSNTQIEEFIQIQNQYQLQCLMEESKVKSQIFSEGRTMFSRALLWAQQRMGYYDTARIHCKMEFEKIEKKLAQCPSTSSCQDVLAHIFSVILALRKQSADKETKMPFVKEAEQALMDLFFNIIATLIVPKSGIALPLTYEEMAKIKAYSDHLAVSSVNHCSFDFKIFAQFDEKFKQLAKAQGYQAPNLAPAALSANILKVASPADAEKKELIKSKSPAKRITISQTEEDKLDRLNRFYRRFNGNMIRHLKSLTVIGSNQLVIGKNKIGLGSFLVSKALEDIIGCVPLGNIVNKVGEAVGQYSQVLSATKVSDVLEEGNNLSNIVNFISSQMTCFVQHEASQMINPEAFADYCYDRIKNKITKKISQGEINDLLPSILQFGMSRAAPFSITSYQAINSKKNKYYTNYAKTSILVIHRTLKNDSIDRDKLMSTTDDDDDHEHHRSPQYKYDLYQPISGISKKEENIYPPLVLYADEDSSPKFFDRMRKSYQKIKDKDIKREVRNEFNAYVTDSKTPEMICENRKMANKS